MLHPRITLNCKGKPLSLDPPAVMGIINATPDSFYAGSRAGSVDQGLRMAEQMVIEGAAILDIGGMSSRPGAAIIEVQEELDRVVPLIEAVNSTFPDTVISVDTVRASVAKAAVRAGARIVNDISAGRIDPDMYPTVAGLGVPYILMHMKGEPATMQQAPQYEDAALEVLDFFIAETRELERLGVKDIILDPGFGFGKTIRHNFQLMKQLHIFGVLDYPVMTGISRKSTIYRTLGVQPEEALNGATALHMVALQHGSRLLRVHDVKPAREAILLFQALESA